jgi:hypothetical protein
VSFPAANKAKPPYWYLVDSTTSRFLSIVVVMFLALIFGVLVDLSQVIEHCRTLSGSGY